MLAALYRRFAFLFLDVAARVMAFPAFLAVLGSRLLAAFVTFFAAFLTPAVAFFAVRAFAARVIVLPAFLTVLGSRLVTSCVAFFAAALTAVSARLPAARAACPSSDR